MIYYDIIAGILSGIAGAMGLGGGSFLLLYLTLILSTGQLKAQGINLLFFIPCAILSLLFHNKNKLIKWKFVIPIAIGGIIGVAFGTYLTTVIPAAIIRKIFGVFILIMGLKELFLKPTKKEDLQNSKSPKKHF